MKKILLILLISFGLIGCSSLELEAVSSSAEETQKILALGLSHEENLVEVSKLKSTHMASVVTGQLIKARDEKIQDEIDFIESEKYAEMVKVTENGLSFIGPVTSESIKTGVLETDKDLQNYYLEGIKDSNSEVIEHILHVRIYYNSKNKRNYISANLCDKWGRCDNNKQQINVISVSLSNCTTSSCDFSEVLELNLGDQFLKDSINNGFTMRFNGKKKIRFSLPSKIKVSSAYLKGYLKVAK
jgi:hypothetical protein